MNPPDLPFTVIVPTIYGPMLVNRHDLNQTGALFKTGKAIDHEDIAMMARILQVMGPDRVFVDVGANVGTYSLALSRAVGPGGKIHGFEPQRIIFNMFVGTVALNSLSNVYCYNMAVGAREGKVEIPQFDYSSALNFGSIEFGPEQHEKLQQERGHDPQKIEYVPLTTIDRFDFPQLNLMKIDAEGMEMQVLEGADATLRRCRPVLYVEFLKSDVDALKKRIESLEYTVYEHKKNLMGVPRELGEKIHIQQHKR